MVVVLVMVGIGKTDRGSVVSGYISIRCLGGTMTKVDYCLYSAGGNIKGSELI